jgi:hypothetical protein
MKAAGFYRGVQNDDFARKFMTMKLGGMPCRPKE